MGGTKTPIYRALRGAKLGSETVDLIRHILILEISCLFVTQSSLSTVTSSPSNAIRLPSTSIILLLKILNNMG